MRTIVAVVLFALCSGTANELYGQGILLQSSGPVNQSMSGASVAAPLDALGALYWNPASISGLEKSELSVGTALLLTTYNVSSSIPGVGAGGTGTEPGVSPIPNIGWVHQTPVEGVKIGLGLQSAAGYYSNTPTDPNNPILAAPPNGLGRFWAQAIFLQVAPVLSYAVSDQLSIGGGPVLTMGNLASNINFLSTPNANGLFPTGDGTRYAWGGGFQLGAYYVHDACWSFGASFKSPAWMERFRYNSEDANGLPRTLRTNFDLPMVVSIGTSYSGNEDTVVALDVRFLDYKNTNGFGSPAEFGPDGAVDGLGWSSQLAVAIGVQRRLNEAVSVRAGYLFASSLISDEDAFFNLGTNLGYNHMPSMGASMKLGENVAVSMAYSWVVEQSIEGPAFAINNAPIPGSTVKNTTDAHVATMGLTVTY